MNFKVTFHLDGTGIIYNQCDPIHLDALLCWIVAPFQRAKKDLRRDDKPDDIKIPLLRSEIQGELVWHASALFTEGKQEEFVTYYRKRLRSDKLHFTEGTFNITNGAYRAHNIPFPTILCSKMSAYASGNRKEVKRLLKRHLRYLGKKRRGNIVDITCENTNQDWSLIKDGLAMRYLPDKKGNILVRTSPPYWNNYGKTLCCNVGDAYEITNVS